MISLTITAHLSAATVGVVEHPFMLDGPLAWAAAMDAKARGVLEPMTSEHVPDMDLPLERWEESGTWGWQVSQASYEVLSYTAIEIRRKPATAEMARYTREREHHSGLGPYKARDVTKTAAWLSPLVWHAEVTDRARLEKLLSLVTHLGGHAAIGYGKVARWEVTDGVSGGWRDRPMPSTHPHLAVRAPYWSNSRRVNGISASSSWPA